MFHMVFSRRARFPVSGPTPCHEPGSRVSSMSHSQNASGLISVPIAAEDEVMVSTKPTETSPVQSGQLVPSISLGFLPIAFLQSNAFTFHNRVNWLVSIIGLKFSCCLARNLV